MTHQSGSPTRLRNPTLGCIAAGRRRRVLGLLLDRGSSVTERDLAVRLVAPERGASGADEAAAEVPDVRADLVHVHLPKLVDVGLVAWDRDEATVRPTGHPALGDPRFRRLLDADADGIDAVLSVLSHEHRRIVLTALDEARAPMTRTRLARELLRREASGPSPGSNTVEEVLVSLHHTHLPRLADAGLTEYDPDTDRVAYAGHPALEAVFRIVFEPDEQVVDKLDGFLGGLNDSYRRASGDASERFDWPNFWSEPYPG